MSASLCFLQALLSVANAAPGVCIQPVNPVCNQVCNPAQQLESEPQEYHTVCVISQPAPTPQNLYYEPAPRYVYAPPAEVYREPYQEPYIPQPRYTVPYYRPQRERFSCCEDCALGNPCSCGRNLIEETKDFLSNLLCCGRHNGQTIYKGEDGNCYARDRNGYYRVPCPRYQEEPAPQPIAEPEPIGYPEPEIIPPASQPIYTQPEPEVVAPPPAYVPEPAPEPVVVSPPVAEPLAPEPPVYAPPPVQEQPQYYPNVVPSIPQYAPPLYHSYQPIQPIIQPYLQPIMQPFPSFPPMQPMQPIQPVQPAQPILEEPEEVEPLEPYTPVIPEPIVPVTAGPGACRPCEPEESSKKSCCICDKLGDCCCCDCLSDCTNKCLCQPCHCAKNILCCPFNKLRGKKCSKRTYDRPISVPPTVVPLEQPAPRYEQPREHGCGCSCCDCLKNIFPHWRSEGSSPQYECCI